MKLNKPQVSENLIQIENFEITWSEAQMDEMPIRNICLKTYEKEQGDLAKIDLSNSKIEKCRFMDCDMHNASFVDVIFENCDFSNSMFQNAYFLRCQFHNCKFLGCKLQDRKSTRLNSSH